MKELFIIFLVVCNCCAIEFPLQYIGDALSVNEANARDLCKNKYCVLDSELLFYAASQNASADPCVDFKEFSMGTFIKYRALNERYDSIGFSPEADRDHEERLRKLLASKIDEKSDPRIFKVIKIFFRKCVNSRNVVKNGTKEIIEYLKSLGGSPILNDASWNPDSFNLSKIFQQEPSRGILDLLGYSLEVTHVDDIEANFTSRLGEKPLYYKFKCFSLSKYECSKVVDAYLHTSDSERRTYTQYKEMLKELFQFPKHNLTYRKFLEEKMDKAIEGVRVLDDEIRKLKSTSENTILKVKELNNYAPNLNIDWLRIMNDQLLFSQQITEDSEIVFDSPDKLKSMSAALNRIDKRLLADAFVLKFLYANRNLFIVYPFDWIDEKITSNTRAFQRWQQCLNFVQSNMGPALEIMLLTSHDIDKRHIINMAKGAVQDFIDKVKTMKDCVISKEDKQIIENRLNNMTYLIGFFSANYQKSKNNSTLEWYYEELPLKGNENLVQSSLEIQKFYKRISNENDKAPNIILSKFALDHSAQSLKISTNLNNNVLYIPASRTFYPWYHPDRPRFFNQATLYVDIIAALKFSTAVYIKTKLNHNIVPFLNNLDELKLAYDSYVSWEANGGKELLLSANRMTNQQLFWIALARIRYAKTKYIYDGSLGANPYDNTVFVYNLAYYDLNSFETIKEVFNCKEKKTTADPIDGCEANSNLLAPFNNIHYDAFKIFLETIGFTFS